MEPVAIVGVGFTLPGDCDDENQFWSIIEQGTDVSSSLDSDRIGADVRGLLGPYGAEDKLPHLRSYLIDGHRSFPAAIDIDPKAASSLDRGSLHAVNAAYQAFCNVKQVCKDKTGVILGSIALPSKASSDYVDSLVLDGFKRTLDKAYNGSSVARNRANFYSASQPSYWVARGLGLGGISYSLDAACASSIYAIGFACDQLNSGRSDLMLSGGVCAPDSLFTQLGFTQLQALSQSGKLCPLDHKADGLLVGEGAVVFALKRLKDAERDGEKIYGVIRGIGVSNDKRGALMAPNSDGQLIAMQSAYRSAGWKVSDVSYIECHATGTKIGDKVELDSLHRLWADEAKEEGCVIGAGKANFGHLLTAAGALGLARVLAGFDKGMLPPTANFERSADARLGFGDSASKERFEVLQKARTWQVKPGQTRKAAVSAFGFGGTNAHLLVEQYQASDNTCSRENSAILPLKHTVSSDEDPICIVGFDIKDSQSLSETSSVSMRQPWKEVSHWYGLEDSSRLKELIGDKSLYLSSISSVKASFARYKTTPNDLKACLPQQLLMLASAYDVINFSGLNGHDFTDYGVFIGLEVDATAHSYGGRIRLDEMAETYWQEGHNVCKGFTSKKAWTAYLKESYGPQLNAARVMGSLASITASRIAKCFGFAGLGVSVSMKDASGLYALSQAVQSIQMGHIKGALVGAIDFPTQLPAALAALDQKSFADIKDGAISLVLMKSSYAKEKGLRILHRINSCELDEALSKIASASKTQLGLGAGEVKSNDSDDYGAATGLMHFVKSLQLPDHAHMASTHPSDKNALDVAIQGLMPWSFSQRKLGSSSQNPERDQLALYDYKACKAFAVGTIGSVFGESFSEIDKLPSRVRLPSDELLLCHRVMSLEGEAKSLGSGFMITEHDVSRSSWYLDNDRIPTAIAIEAGQADLMLSAWLGADLFTKGLSYYRLLDAKVTYHSQLPCIGDVISYHIKIHNFFNQGPTLFFRFSFDAFVGDKPLMTMEDGCAGFFTPRQLDAGKGIVRPAYKDRPRLSGAYTGGYEPMFKAQRSSYDDKQIKALYAGDLAGCFGETFAGLSLENPLTLPGGDLSLVHRIINLDSEGGWYGLGEVIGEADIDPDSWFLTSHFKDDPVMPGTLMYECCLHTLRVFFLRSGLVDACHLIHAGPVTGVKSQLKCRGQVLPSTKKVSYELHIREMGYGPDAYAICDAVMYADGRAIVDIQDMSLCLHGLNAERVNATWAKKDRVESKHVVFSSDELLAFSTGRVSDVLGDAYKAFDGERKMARLPRVPLQLISSIDATDLAPKDFRAGASLQASYEISDGIWFMGVNGDRLMPFGILVEIGLQPCGWMSAYMGSALQSQNDLHFRNLGATATIHGNIDKSDKTLFTYATCTQNTKSADMILQSYQFEICRPDGSLVYSAETNFGFFTKSSLASQKGLSSSLYDVLPNDHIWDDRLEALDDKTLFAQDDSIFQNAWRRIENVASWSEQQGRYGRGRLVATQDIDPSDWYFNAHFYEDPVMPGSLGLEGLIQAASLAARRLEPSVQSVGHIKPKSSHSWIYRGQVVPSNKRLVYDIHVKGFDRDTAALTFDGVLWVDGLPIYRFFDVELEFS
jgi:3-oxoacyl-(acyl-carrier-protein) synthase/3-hydroxymyristoyl/3-hydroxydecanoyl-(acyl carrier protein) dehydratase